MSTTKPTGEILEVLFLSDVNGLRGHSTQPYPDYLGKALPSPGSYADDGFVLRKPEWTKPQNATQPTHNSPVVFVKGQRIKLSVTLVVRPATARFRLSGFGNEPYLTFTHVDPVVATGLPQKVHLTAQASLPGKVLQLSRTINWAVQGVGDSLLTKFGSTGPHQMFVLFGNPIETSSFWNMSNYLTYKRIKLLTSDEIAGGKLLMDDIAAAIHRYVNRHAAKGMPNVTYSKQGDGGQLWALLDRSRVGRCGELSYLMELMNRLLGIRAVQRFVYGGTTAESIARSLNNDGKTAPGEKRKCPNHGDETLHLNFGGDLTGTETGAINVGEGTCDVNGRLYAGLLDLVGIAQEGRTAAHNLLLKMEESFQSRTKPVRAFQVWVCDKPPQQMEKKGINLAVCSDEVVDSQSKRVIRAFPPVPK